jgi:hypothetical protein
VRIEKVMSGRRFLEDSRERYCSFRRGSDFSSYLRARSDYFDYYLHSRFSKSISFFFCLSFI